MRRLDVTCYSFQGGFEAVRTLVTRPAYFSTLSDKAAHGQGLRALVLQQAAQTQGPGKLSSGILSCFPKMSCSALRSRPSAKPIALLSVSKSFSSCKVSPSGDRLASSTPRRTDCSFTVAFVLQGLQLAQFRFALQTVRQASVDLLCATFLCRHGAWFTVWFAFVALGRVQDMAKFRWTLQKRNKVGL